MLVRSGVTGWMRGLAVIWHGSLPSLWVQLRRSQLNNIMPSSVSPKPGIEEARAIFIQEGYSPAGWQHWCEAFEWHGGIALNDDTKGLTLFAIPTGLKSMERIDTWFVWYARGSIESMFSLLPRPLPWVAWYRRKTKCLHFTRWDRIRRLTMKGVTK